MNAQPHRGKAAVRLVLEKVPLLVLVAACAAVTVWAQRSSDYEYGTWQWRIGNALISYVVYLRQFFWPVDLALLYVKRDEILPLWQIIGSAAILLGVTTACVLLRRRCPYLLVGWLWYLGMLLPVVGLVPFGNQAPADRFTYLPQIGIAIALVWGAADLCQTWPYRRWVCAAGSALVLLPLMACAWQQTSYWRNSLTLWKHSLVCMPDNYRVHTLLGNALAKRDRVDDAIAQFRQALKIHPKCAEAFYGLGVAAAGRGRLDEAIVHYQAALNVNSTYANAHNNLGNALLTLGQVDAAIAHCQAAVDINPNLAEGYFNLGNALFVCRHLDTALVQYEKALEAQPDYADARYNIGLIWATRGKVDKAIEEYRKAIGLNPNLPEVYNSLGLALAAVGQSDEAVAQYRQALRLRPNFAEARLNLDKALSGRIP
jgi:tetratricopeptide (TPR) repeat protein